MGKAADLGLPAGFSGGSKDTGTMIVNLRGHTGVGKTYTALKTIPGPVVYLNGDRDNSLLVRRLRTKFLREIITTAQYIMKFKGDVMRAKGNAADDNAERARIIRNRFKDEFSAALESKARYIVIDQSYAIWQLVRLSWYGKLIEVPAILYSQANWEMEQIVHQADNTGKVVIWLSLLDDIWEDVIEMTPNGPKKTRKTTGKFKTRGFDSFDSMMGVVGEMHYDLEQNIRSIKVIKGLSGMGKVLSGKECTIPNLLALATGEPVEKWQ